MQALFLLITVAVLVGAARLRLRDRLARPARPDAKGSMAMTALLARSGGARAPRAGAPTRRGWRRSATRDPVRTARPWLGCLAARLFTVLAIVPAVCSPRSATPTRCVLRAGLAPSGATTGWARPPTARTSAPQLVYGTRPVAGHRASWPACSPRCSRCSIGVSAAYLGGVRRRRPVDCMTDVFLVIPTLPADHRHRGLRREGDSLLVLIVVLVITGWSYGARQLRAQALSLRNRDFLRGGPGARRAALLHHRVRGAADDDVADRGQLPRCRAVLRADRVPACSSSASATRPRSSWGTMLYWAQNNAALQTGHALWGDRARPVHRRSWAPRSPC